MFPALFTLLCAAVDNQHYDGLQRDSTNDPQRVQVSMYRPRLDSCILSRCRHSREGATVSFSLSVCFLLNDARKSCGNES